MAPAGLAPVMPDNTFSWGIYFRWISPQRIARTLGRAGMLALRGLLAAAGIKVTNPTFPPLYVGSAVMVTGMPVFCGWGGVLPAVLCAVP
jgi:hypothetical protein